ncbi:MAG TPA: TolC family protein [Terriglobia bacterium]|nr:TolC family protein [Terriglobia bacterium]
MIRRICFPLLIALMISCSTPLFPQNVQSLTLQEAEAQAVSHHPQISSVRYSALAAGQATREQQSAYYPFAFGNLTGAGADPNSRLAAGGLNNPIIYNRYANGVTVGQFITDFGRTQNLVESARLHAQAAQENVQTARMDVMLQVDRAYFDVLKAQAVLKVAERTVSDRQLVSDQVTELEKSKLKSGLDVSFANVNLAEAKLFLVRAQNDEQAGFAALSAALGYSDARTFELADVPVPSAPPQQFADLVAQAFQNRPELIGQHYNQQAAEKFARAERDLWFPTISGVATAGITPLHQRQLADNYAAAGLNVNIPIFNGHLFAARRAEAEFKAKAEEENLRDLRDHVARDVRVAWLNANTAYQRLGLTDQLLQQAKQAFDLAQERYKLGLSSIIELSQAQLNLTQAQTENVGANYEYQISRADLDYQIGSAH